MNEQQLFTDMIIGFALSFAAGTPIAKWYESLTPNSKGVVMLVASLIVAAVFEFVECANGGACEIENLQRLTDVALRAFVVFASSQTFHNGRKWIG